MNHLFPWFDQEKRLTRLRTVRLAGIATSDTTPKQNRDTRDGNVGPKVNHEPEPQLVVIGIDHRIPNIVTVRSELIVDIATPDEKSKPQKSENPGHRIHITMLLAILARKTKFTRTIPGHTRHDEHTYENIDDAETTTNTPDQDPIPEVVVERALTACIGEKLSTKPEIDCCKCNRENKGTDGNDLRAGAHGGKATSVYRISQSYN